MKAILFLSTLVFAAGAFAGELDDESKVTNQQLQGTAVVRVDTRSGEVATLTSDKILASAEEAAALATLEFTATPNEKVRSELDTDGGSSSWYVYWHPYRYAYAPVYAYYGYYWRPYYVYTYNYYTYYYYGHYRRWW